MSNKNIKENGFVLITVLILMVLLAVTALALNSRASLQVKMSTNQAESIQTALGQASVIEQSLWQLTRDPVWRTSPSGEGYTYNGITYNRTILNSSVAGYTDAFTVSVTAPGGLRPLRSSFRYYIDTPFLVRKPNGVFCDVSGNIFFADSDNHTVWKIKADTGTIQRVAGNGLSGFNGDGGPASQANLDTPQGVSVDMAGNIYIADTMNCRIRKVDAYGRISTYAGTGEGGYSGDGGPATNARLKNPMRVAFDSSGNLYIADTDNNVIRKVNATNGYITTIAGTGQSGYVGDGGPATSATFKKPQGVFVDISGNIYIADTDNNCIRKVDAVSPHNINRVAGTGGSGGYSGDGLAALLANLNKPQSVFVDPPGNIYIADTDNSRVRRVDGATGIISTIVGTGAAGYSGDGGNAILAQIDHPRGIFLKNTGEMIVSDTINCCLRRVTAGSISTVAVTAGPGLNNPSKVSLYYDNVVRKHYLFIADANNHRIRKMDTVTNMLSTIAGTGTGGYSGDGGQATAAALNTPKGVFTDTGGNIYIADTNNHVIRKINTSGLIFTVAGVDPSSAGFNGDGIQATTAKLDSPNNIFVDSSGNIYIADTNNHRIRKVDAGTGQIQTVAGTGQVGSSGDGGPATLAKINKPTGVFLDSSGNIYIADSNNNRVRKVDAGTGQIQTIAGTGGGGYDGDGGPATSATLNRPSGIAVDGAGNVYIADSFNNVLRIVSIHDGNIYTLAGTGGLGFNGDNQPAVSARFNGLNGIALALTKGSGKIYISDMNNNRIRLLNFYTVKELY